MTGTLGREVISTRQRKIAELARREPKLTLTTLAHHIDSVWMREAYRRTRKDAAAGVDGVTAAQYEAELEANLTSLLERFKSGRYRAPAVRRVHLDKPGTNKKRPIGIPPLEDKVLQRAVLMVLEPVYEQDFLDCSYGFRPGRGAHQALDSLWQGLMKLGGGWVIDLDIEDFFGSVDWGQLRSFLDQRVRDGVIRRAIGKWLNAGVMEAGELSYPQRGASQGGVSPTLSNVATHLRKLEALAEELLNFTLTLHASEEMGRATVETFLEANGLDASSRSIAFCGPETMRKALAEGFAARGMAVRRMRYEAFEIRSGLGLTALAAHLTDRIKPSRGVPSANSG